MRRCITRRPGAVPTRAVAKGPSLWLRGRVHGAGAEGAAQAAGVAARMIRRSVTGCELCIVSRRRVAVPDCIGVVTTLRPERKRNGLKRPRSLRKRHVRLRLAYGVSAVVARG